MFDPKWKKIPISIKMERWRRHKILQKALQLRRKLSKTMRETIGQDNRALLLGILAAATADAEALAEEARKNIKYPPSIDILRWVTAAHEEYEKRKVIKETKKMLP